MRVLFVNPSQEKVYGKKMKPAYPPLGLLYVGSVLKREGHEIKLVDIDIEDISPDRFNNILEKFSPDVVGVTCTTPTVNDALKWAGAVKRHNENIQVILGGVHPTIAPEEVAGHADVDIVVIGEAEETVKELFRQLSSSYIDLRGVKGISYKSGGRVVTNEPRPFIDDLDSIPFPDRGLLARPGAYLPPDAIKLPVASIMTSRGCPGGCTFCCTKNIFSKRFRARSVKNIMEEINQLVKNEKVKEIHIIDDVFTLDKKRTLEFCGEVKKQGLELDFQFINGLRADFVDEDILKALKSIGVKTVGYGVETGNEEILKNIKKNIPLGITRKAFRLSKKLGFETWAFLIFGLPGETELTIRQTIDFTKELNPDFAKFLILKPYPGSEVFEQLKKKNLILNMNYDFYGVYTGPIHRLPGLEPEKMTYWQKRAFREFYLRPSKILFNLKRIKSWTQFKLLVNDVLFAMYLMFKKDKK